MPEQPKRKTPFDPIWKEDFKELKHLSSTEFVLRQLLRVHRNFETSITHLSNLQIQKITGLNRQTIKKSIDKLCHLGYIVRKGYHIYYIRSFERYQCSEEQIENDSLLPTKDKSGYLKHNENLK